jgi:hypothetical protein
LPVLFKGEEAMRHFLVFVAIGIVALSASVQARPMADIALTKSVYPSSPNMYRPGDTILYVMSVMNSSTTDSMRIDLVEEKLPDGTTVSLAFPPFPYVLQPGTYVNYVYYWRIPGNACWAFPTGMVENHLHCVGVQFSTVNEPFDVDVQKTSMILCPCVQVTETAWPATSKAGDDVTYTITVKNCGNCALTLTNIMDSLLGDISASFATTLAISATESHQFTRTVLASDPDPLVSIVTVSYNDVLGAGASAAANATVDLVHPYYTVTKTCLTNPAPPNGLAEFRITITNMGDVNLIINTDDPAIPGPFTLATGGPPFVQDVSRPVPPGAQEVCNTIEVTATLPPELGLGNQITETASGCCPVVDLADVGVPAGIPSAYRLHQSCPNPFSGATLIQYDLPGPVSTKIRVYDVGGRVLRVLVDSPLKQAGRHEARWDGRDANGDLVASGIYFYRMEAGTFTDTEKMILTR